MWSPNAGSVKSNTHLWYVEGMEASVYKAMTANIILYGEILNAFPPSKHLLSDHVCFHLTSLQIPTSAIQHDTKSLSTGKEKANGPHLQWHDYGIPKNAEKQVSLQEWARKTTTQARCRKTSWTPYNSNRQHRELRTQQGFRNTECLGISLMSCGNSTRKASKDCWEAGGVYLGGETHSTFRRKDSVRCCQLSQNDVCINTNCEPK